MNPPSNEGQGLNLPPPIAEPMPAAPGGFEAHIPTPELGNVPSQQPPFAAQQAAPIPMPAAAPPSVVPAATDVSATTNNVSQNVVDDGDLIEKEWVMKAKQIVEANRDDPYKQTEEMTLFKADYMQKRYNKSIKVSK